MLTHLGKGGMGEVWKARDTKLDRDVAIKILPSELVNDPERLARFEREAKTLASLNHPNIAAIYGFEKADATPFIVLEYVEGVTLSDRLKSGALQTDDAMEVGKQIAEALEAAHDKGVIHRDLKPANVQLRDDGTVKVLDFGLAKAFMDQPSESTIANSPTITQDFTRPGMVLGTAPYMSPEQARARVLDKRSDIWSFGVVLYECLTGEMLFGGETPTDSMGAIMHKQPDWAQLPASMPPGVHHLLRRCLTKDRKRRLQDIGDARVELEEAIGDPTTSSFIGLAPVETAAAAPSSGGLMGKLVAFVLGCAIIGAAWFAMRPAEPVPELRRFEFAVDLKPRNVRISPDGTMVAFVSQRTLHVRHFDELTSRTIYEPEGRGGVDNLTWSLDSQWLIWRDGNGVWKIPATGGERHKISDADEPGQIQAAPDGSFITTSWSSGIGRLSADGTVEEMFPTREGENHFHPGGVLPDDKGVLFVPHLDNDDVIRHLNVGTYDGNRILLYEHTNTMNYPVYSATGHIVFGQPKEPKGVFALPFSLERMEVTGSPILLVPGVSSVSISSTGDMVYTRQGQRWSRRHRLTWFDRQGQMVEQVGPVWNGAFGLIVSPDETMAVISSKGIGEQPESDDSDLWLIDLDRETTVRIAREEKIQMPFAWHPDGSRIAYGTITPPSSSDVYVRTTDGAGAPTLLIKDAFSFAPNDDWTTAVFLSGSWMESTVNIQELSDPSSRREFLAKSDGSRWNQIRPGGGLTAYTVGDRIGDTSDLMLRRFPDGDGRWKVTMDSVKAIRWSHDGEKLYYVAEGLEGEANLMMEIPITLENGSVTLGTATQLFPWDDVSESSGFYVSRDDERFLVLKSEDDPRASEEDTREGIILIQNWPRLLGQ